MATRHINLNSFKENKTPTYLKMEILSSIFQKVLDNTYFLAIIFYFTTINLIYMAISSFLISYIKLIDSLFYCINILFFFATRYS